jgi:predicted TPR repeat methyltransferase
MEQVHATVDPHDLIRRVAALIQAGQTGAARPLLVAARRINGPSAGLSHLAAMLALREGTVDEAREDLDLAIAQTPNHPGLRKCRAELRHRIGDVEGATRDAAEAVILDRADPVAKALLGTLMLELGRTAEALSCLGEAVRGQPADPAFREALAAAQVAAGMLEEALTTLETGIALAPTVVSLRNAAVMLCIRRRDFAGAIRLAEQARSVGIADACLFGLYGHALSSLGRHDQAAETYREALKLGPDDPYVRHLVSTSGAMPQGRRAPEAYLKTVFDGYADRFEGHLISLGYRIPGVVRAVVQAHPRIVSGEGIGPVLDLGCGTGLVGLALADLKLGPITGIDISARMLEQARIKSVYTTLIEADLITALGGGLAARMPGQTHWPLVIAADVLCYFGALDDVLAAVHARLEPGGWFIFSLEVLLPDHDGVVPGNGDWALLRQGRYAHALDYARRAALDAGFVIRRLASEVVRHEAGVAVDGVLVVLERARHDG